MRRCMYQQGDCPESRSCDTQSSVSEGTESGVRNDKQVSV